jgi:hypothetical protein
VLNIYKTQRNATNLIPNVHQPSKKRKKSTTNSIVDFFCNKIPYKKIDPSQELFFKDLTLKVIKGYPHLSSIENIMAYQANSLATWPSCIFK